MTEDGEFKPDENPYASPRHPSSDGSRPSRLAMWLWDRFLLLVTAVACSMIMGGLMTLWLWMTGEFSKR